MYEPTGTTLPKTQPHFFGESPSQEVKLSPLSQRKMTESSSYAHVISPPRLRKKGTEGPSAAATELVAKARLVQQLITGMSKHAPRRALNQPMSTVLDAGREGLTRRGIEAAMNVLSGIAKAARQNAVNNEAAMAAVNKALSAMESTGYGSDDSEPEVVFAADPNRQQPAAVAAATITLPQELSTAPC